MIAGQSNSSRVVALLCNGLAFASILSAIDSAHAQQAHGQYGNMYVGGYPAGNIGPTAATKLDFGGGYKMGYLISKVDPELTGGGSQTGFFTSRFKPVRFGGGAGKLSVYGQLNGGFIYSDNAGGDDFYLSENAASPNVLGVRARYDINEQFRIGGRLSITAAFNRSDLKNDFNDEAGCDERDPDRNVCWYDANVFVRSKSFGKLTFGLGETASAGIGGITLGGTGAVTNNDPNLKAGGQEFYPSETVDRAAPDVTGVTRGTLIRYDSPTIAGFMVSASWGDADHTGAPSDAENYYDIALRYAGQIGDFRVAAGISYQDYDRDGGDDLSQSNFTLGGSVQHVPTGIFLASSYDNLTRNAPGDPAPDETDDAHAWYVQAGIGRNWTGLGKTTLYTEYGKTEHGADAGWYFYDNSSTSNFGLGVVQNIDRCSKQVYATYNHIEADIGGADGDVNVFMLGTRFKF